MASNDAIYSEDKKTKLKSLLGKLIWIALGIRPSLSFLRYVFLITHKERKTTPSLHRISRREVTAFAAILPLAHINTTRPLWDTLLAFDASEKAAGIVYAHVNPNLGMFIHSLGARGAEVSKLNRQKLEVAVNSQNWLTAFVHCWRYKQHINVLECHAGVLALEWAVSHPIQSHRITLLSDSTAVIGALRKGRTSYFDLSLPTRRFAAMTIAHDLLPHLIQIPSHINPADGPSRLKRC